MLTADPLWFKDAVIYQVHVKAFFDSNDDGIGDFPGLTAKLDHVKSLGATCIWLLPFFPSPMRDDGYDIADYRNVNPAFGTTQDFRAFVRAAHERGIRVLIELVVNHTSDQHPWFKRARAAKRGSVWRDFYVWSDDDKKYADTRIIFTDTETSNWTWDPVAGQYYWHRFFSHQPDLNYDNPRVIEAILNVMRFWFDTGVDGMRLDAVPYLCEREGTNNENLPETHGVLKILRAVCDAEYPDKIFLAEANQWPEDVRPYFGDGDECHMAFHFPLMPRMYMAVAEEDRYPIVDIMRQTPDIPDSCQWAIFLRNHDEMTLEMVTDRERDNMYRIYATDPRARINVGIRRRLAPLMENDRRRIELLTGLLLSMPGTPIVYYGDEIGMGDNVYLNDRDGVRTPMQWSIDRNGGFSRADPARLFLPPIQDPVYGYQTVNVEAQARSASSPINWLRRMIAVRQNTKVFGRGTLRFLQPTNRKVIAYVREYEDERVLCVANLSRSAQQVALDLRDYEGFVPVEMVGWSAFQTIGTERYVLTLPGHGFYWFLLSKTAQAPSWSADTFPMPELLTLVLPRERGATALGAKSLALFEREILPGYLPTQRWFADKGRAVGLATVVDTGRIDEPGAGIVGSLTIVEAAGVRYFVPLAIVPDDERGAPKRSILAKTRAGATTGFLCDGLAIDRFIGSLVAMLCEERTVETTRDGRFVATATDAMRDVAAQAPEGVRRLDVEQSNTSIVIGERFVIKAYRRVTPGPQPEFEVARFLDRVGFENAPQLLGTVEHVADDGATTALCIAQRFIHNQGDGWNGTLAYLGRYFDEVRAGHEPSDDLFVERMARLGTRTAELHLAFATSVGDPAFEPERVTQADFNEWTERARASATRALEALGDSLERVPSDVRPFAESLLVRRDEIFARMTLPPLGEAELVNVRLHGDYHLGQVLAVADDFVIVDFEGEPARPLEERRRKSSPLRDVAGMLRSFNYAVVAGVRGLDADRIEDASVLEPSAARWERRSAEAFLAGYRATVAGSPVSPSDPALEQRMLELFVLEKAFYEMSYELANRPAWVRIPLEGIASIVGRTDREAVA